MIIAKRPALWFVSLYVAGVLSLTVIAMLLKFTLSYL